MTELLSQLAKETASGTEVGKILGYPVDFPSELVETLSLQTAINYWHGKINYEDGDIIMNNLYSFWVTNTHYVQNFGFGKIAWNCYEAFDAGEYQRPTDPQDIDPVEAYTKPIIEKLLIELNKI
ncbi:hypothetical protein ABV409_11930 [Flagellimonas sp. DF-77]|uniref:hypothetical protein n=1 Tax=Flagellimonas algarum TaxID=3230298 RepID=UPI0033913DC5